MPAEYAPSEDGTLLENAICVERQEKTAWSVGAETSINAFCFPYQKQSKSNIYQSRWFHL